MFVATKTNLNSISVYWISTVDHFSYFKFLKTLDKSFSLQITHKLSLLRKEVECVSGKWNRGSREWPRRISHKQQLGAYCGVSEWSNSMSR